MKRYPMAHKVQRPTTYVPSDNHTLDHLRRTLDRARKRMESERAQRDADAAEATAKVRPLARKAGA